MVHLELVEALRECLGAMDSMQLQIEQMKGMFDDHDHAIAESLAECETAQLTAREALLKYGHLR